MRKDVEDVFGILKKRFRLLCNAIELHSKDQIDNVFFTSCILHNILLSYGNTPVAEGTMLRPYIADHIEEEVQTTHYELRRDLIVHHSVARRKRELIWL